FATPLGDVAVALMAGNGVVLKPSPHSALTGERILRIFARAGLPEGLLRIVHGYADAGRALVDAPVAQVRFTGSLQAGRDVGEAIADALAGGATLCCGGPAEPAGLPGTYVAPAVLTNVTAQMRLAREEVPGPVLWIDVVDTEDEAIAAVNAENAGLGASVWT